MIKQVVNGARFLDDAFPGWYERIDTKAFDISTMTKCPLGQLYGNWSDGMLTLFGDTSNPGNQEYAFDCLDGYSIEEVNQAWIEEINKRCSAQQSQSIRETLSVALVKFYMDKEIDSNEFGRAMEWVRDNA